MSAPLCGQPVNLSRLRDDIANDLHALAQVSYEKDFLRAIRQGTSSPDSLAARPAKDAGNGS
jgi:hypothetical protein